jgi:hypothetical protein
MAVFIAICISLPSWVIKALEKMLKAFLWSGMDIVQGSKCLLAWKRVQRPRHLGGLGILDLSLFSSVLWL